MTDRRWDPYSYDSTPINKKFPKVSVIMTAKVIHSLLCLYTYDYTQLIFQSHLDTTLIFHLMLQLNIIICFMYLVIVLLNMIHL